MNLRLQDLPPTSAAKVAEKHGATIHVIAFGGSLAVAGTSGVAPTQLWQEPFAPDRVWTSVSEHAANLPVVGLVEPPDSTSRAISELRRVSGLTWEELGHLFGVSRRSVHFWVSGRAMKADHERRLFRILDVVRNADRGDARSNRAALCATSRGKSTRDLLAEEAYREAEARLGSGRPRIRREPGELDDVALAARRTTSPEKLFDARSDRIHHPEGGGPAFVVRTTRRDASR